MLSECVVDGYGVVCVCEFVCCWWCCVCVCGVVGVLLGVCECVVYGCCE